MHAAACAAARQAAMWQVPGRFDVVITTNSGFPLDQNLYQAVKGISCLSGDQARRRERLRRRMS
jgi:hypothetical protein